jgi:hypothetical protein
MNFQLSLNVGANSALAQFSLRTHANVVKDAPETLLAPLTRDRAEGFGV